MKNPIHRYPAGRDRKPKIHRLLSTLAIATALAGCATEASRSLPVAPLSSVQTPYSGARVAIAVGKFDNRSSYMRGIFTDGIDRLGGQAKTILLTALQESGRCNVLERANLDENHQQAVLLKKGQTLKGASFVVTGDVT